MIYWINPVDKSGGETLRAGNLVLSQFRAGMKEIYFCNNVPYSYELEMGHSSQAPGGMVRITAAEAARFFDEAANVYDNVASVSQGAFSAMSNSLADFFTTGKANFNDYLTTFLKGITQMLTQIALVNSAKSAAGIFGFAGGGAVPQFDSGGYTGAGGKFEPKGIVHGGEFVFTKEATSAIGVENLYAMMHNAQGYADGGVVGRAPMYGLSGGGLTVNVDAPVSFTQEGGAGANNSSRKGAESIGNLVKSVVQQEVTTRLRKELAEGGILYKRS